MKLPNGYGSVYKLTGKRRKPWGARITVGWEVNESTGKTKQKYKAIGYYETRKQALEALAKYNSDPYDLGSDKITFTEVYEKWSEEHFKTIVPSAVRTWTAAYKHCVPIHNKNFKELRTIDLEKTL